MRWHIATHGIPLIQEPNDPFPLVSGQGHHDAYCRGRLRSASLSISLLLEVADCEQALWFAFLFFELL